jgi:hypothetical protein
MAKIREKVSIGGFRSISRAGGADSEKQSVRTRTVDTNMDDEANTEYKLGFNQRKMMTIRSREEDISDSEKQSVRTKTGGTVDMNDGTNNTESKPSFNQSKTTTIRFRGDDVNDSTSTGNGRVMLRRSNTTQTLPSRRPSATARNMYNKKRSTTYDDCVIFPFADGGDDGYDEEFTYGRSDRAALRPPNFQVEEYESEREFWRSRSAVDVSSRGMSIRTAH